MLDTIRASTSKLTAMLLALAGFVGLRDEVERVATGQSTILTAGFMAAPAPGLPDGLAADSRAQLGFGTVLAALVVVIGVMLAIIVVDRFDQSLGTVNDSNLSSARNDVLSGFSDMASLIGPLLLVGIATVIIAQLQRTRGR